MNSLDKILETYKQKAIPPLEDGLECRVWKEIRLQKAEKSANLPPSWPSWILESFLQPRLVWGALSLAVLFGISTSWLYFSPVYSNMETRAALDLDIFSAKAPNLPSTLIVSRHE
jgi:hypothetical protein